MSGVMNTTPAGEVVAYRYVRDKHVIFEGVANRWRNADGWIETPLFAQPHPTNIGGV